MTDKSHIVSKIYFNLVKEEIFSIYMKMTDIREYLNFDELTDL